MQTGWDTGTPKMKTTCVDRQTKNMQTGWDTGTPKMKTTCVDRQTKIGKPEKEERKKKSRI